MNTEEYHQDDESMTDKLEDAVSQLTRYGDPDTELFLNIINLLANINDDMKNGREPTCIMKTAEDVHRKVDAIIYFYSKETWG